MIVHSKNESVPSYDGDLVVQLADLYHLFSPVELNLYFTVRTLITTADCIADVEILKPGGLEGTPGNEPVPDGGTINGVGQWDSSNTSFSNFTLEAYASFRLSQIHFLTIPS